MIIIQDPRHSFLRMYFQTFRLKTMNFKFDSTRVVRR